MNTITKPIKVADLIKYIKREAPKDGSVKDISPPNPIVYSDFGPAKLQAYVSSPDESLAGRLHVTLQSVTGRLLTEFNSGEFPGDSRYSVFLTSRNRDILCQRSDGAFEPLKGAFVAASGTADFELPPADKVRDNLELNIDGDNFDLADLINFRSGVASDYELILKFLAAKGI